MRRSSAVLLTFGLFPIGISALADTGIVRREGTPLGRIIVYGTPDDPVPHKSITVEMDSDAPTSHPQRDSDALGQPIRSGAGGIGSPSNYIPRFWTTTLYPGSTVGLNPDGDINGDGEPSFGFGEGSLVPLLPTFAWAKRVEPGDHDPVYAQFVDGSWTTPIVIASDPGDDLDPRWWQDAEGTIHASWWRRAAGSDTDIVLYASRVVGASGFSAPEQVSLLGEAARNPSLAVTPTGVVLIGYETRMVTGERRVLVAAKASPSSSFQSELVGSTMVIVATLPEVRSAAGHEWVIWVDSVDHVGYSERVDGIWTAPAFEAIPPEQSVERARMAVRSTIINR